MINGDKASGGLPTPPNSKWDLTPADKIIKEFEGLFLHAYKDPVGIWTIGYGHTNGVKSGQVITEAQAIQFLEADMTEAINGVDALVKTIMTNNERCSLISFTFNLGVGALQHSTLLKKLNADDTKGAADEFLKWNHAGGQVLAGLTRRRIAERELFLTQDLLLT